MRKGGIFQPPSSGLLPAPVPAAATTAIAAVPSATAVCLRPGLIHVERSAIHLVAIESGYSLCALAVIAHFHECEASWLPGIAVGYDVHTVNRAIRLK